MGRPKTDTVRVNLHLPRDVAGLLRQLAPSENKQGAYIAQLIQQAAQDAGLVPGAVLPSLVDLAVLVQELQESQRRLDDLQARVHAALAQHEEQGQMVGIAIKRD